MLRLLLLALLFGSTVQGVGDVVDNSGHVIGGYDVHNGLNVTIPPNAPIVAPWNPGTGTYIGPGYIFDCSCLAQNFDGCYKWEVTCWVFVGDGWIAVPLTFDKWPA